MRYCTFEGVAHCGKCREAWRAMVLRVKQGVDGSVLECLDRLVSVNNPFGKSLILRPQIWVRMQQPSSRVILTGNQDPTRILGIARHAVEIKSLALCSLHRILSPSQISILKGRMGLK